MSIQDFYATGPGDQLVDARLLPNRVQDFLVGEERLLARFAPGYEVLVEVGSMHGLHLEWAVENGKSYVGVDIVQRYVEAGRRRVADADLPAARYRFESIGAERLPEIALPPGRPVAFFPFNSFGNMEKPLAVLDAVADSGARFLISSYGTDTQSTEVRRKYYAACGFTGVEVHEDAQGVRFTSHDGLNTIAFHEEYLLGLLAERGMKASIVAFAGFGRMYTRFDWSSD